MTIEQRFVGTPFGATVMEELCHAVEHPEYSDVWSDLAASVYFDAAAFHGLEVVNENVADIFSYAMEAAAAFEQRGPRVTRDFELARCCRDWHRGALSRSRFLERVSTLCEEENP